MISLPSLVLALVAASTPVLVNGQQVVLDSDHNATTIVGTWSSGSKSVITGAGFANPVDTTFTYPKVTGVSYSFSTDNWYEIARYRFVSNATDPHCITGVMNWVHGKYEMVSNGSMVLTPAGDGYQQIQDPCAAISNFVEPYNFTELMKEWRIFTDPTDGYKLHLFKFDGSPESPLFQVSTEPTMLPKQKLRNDTVVGTNDNNQAEARRRKRGVFEKRNAAAPSVQASAGAVAAAGVAGILAVAALAL